MTWECSTFPSPSSPSSAPFQPALRNVAFCSCYIYSPRGNSFVSAASRQLCARLKLGDAAWLPSYAGVVRELTMKHETFAELFTADAVLVPVPGSDPSATRVWAAERLAVALHGVLLAKSVWLGVRRRFPFGSPRPHSTQTAQPRSNITSRSRCSSHRLAAHLVAVHPSELCSSTT